MKNSRNKLAILFFLYSVVSMAQVGIGITTPAATLDITAASLTGTTVDGLLIPRVSRLRAQTMTGTPTSTMIYVNLLDGFATLTTINVTAVGFYFFNGTLWEKLASATSGWSVTGNSGLSGTTNFLGTTDDVDLAFRRFNLPAGKIGTLSTSFGINALNAGVATNNTAFGRNALALSTGTDNVAVGNGTLSANTTGFQNTGIGNAALAVNTGNANTAVGFQAMAANLGGANNTAMGFQALAANTGGINSTAIGFQALMRNTASFNTGIGFQALANNVGATQNTGVGYLALGASNGSNNTAVGFSALAANASGSTNTVMGNYALARNLGSGNTAMGHEVEFGIVNSTFSNTTAIGYHALFGNSASNNTAVGYNALQANTSALGNTAVGYSALNNSTGAGNTALGDSAGLERAAGTNNTFVGFEAGRFNPLSTTNNFNAFFGSQAGHYSYGSSNTAIGANTLKAPYPTSNNVAVGTNALIVSQTNNNTAIGYGALSSNAGGLGGNVAIGYNALTGNTGSGNVALGNSAASADLTGSNRLYIENSNADANNALVYGEFNTNIVRVNGTLQISNPATANGYALPIVRGTNGGILQTDGAGGTSWVSSSMVRATLTANQNLGTGWQKMNFNSETFDTGGEFSGGRFTAAKAGFYRINASYHIDSQGNTDTYSIGVTLDGGVNYYQLTTCKHHGTGDVERSVSCLVQLAVGGFVEVWAESQFGGQSINGFSGKTIFEVQQVR